MIRKNCESSQNKPNGLLDMHSGHSEKEKKNIFSVVSLNLKKISNILFNISYSLGLKILKNIKFIKLFFNKVIIYYIKKHVKESFIWLKKRSWRVKNRFINIIRDLKGQIKDFIDIYKLEKNKYNDQKQKKFFKFISVIYNTIFQYKKEKKQKISNLMNYIYPVLGLSVLIVSVNFISNMKYVLSVECLGTNIGYIEDEYVYLDASKQMNSRIHYSVDQVPINDTPRYTLVRLNDKIKCDKKDKIADKILKASDKMICKASGLYVNDNFIGAVKDDLGLQRLLDNYLDPYKELYPDDEVRFVDDVSVKKGYYLTDSVCKLEKLNERISNNVEEEIVYTVQKGDVPSIIASKNSVPYSQLQQLNPDIEQDFKPGKKIVVSKAKPALSVKVNKLNTVKEEIPFEIEKREDANITSAFSKVVEPGKKGVVEKKYKTVIIDGIEMTQELISENIISEPVSEKWLIGTKAGFLKSYDDGDSARVLLKTPLLFPVPGGHISCGWYGYAGHTGIDICAPGGTPIKASASGKVIYSGKKGAYGNYILLDVGNGVVVRYAHNSKNLVSVGDYVDAGQKIAEVGQTGNAYGNHCHFETIINGVPRNPMLYLTK